LNILFNLFFLIKSDFFQVEEVVEDFIHNRGVFAPDLLVDVSCCSAFDGSMRRASMVFDGSAGGRRSSLASSMAGARTFLSFFQ
jgi:hypothetical protein